MDDQNIKDRRLKTKVKLDPESYETLLNMLNGSDEDVVLALECLNNVQQKESLIYTLFLRKNSKTPHHVWKSNCKKVLTYHGSLGIGSDSNVITYNTILELIKLHDNKEENLDFFLHVFASFLKKSFVPVFDFVDDIELKIKVK